MRKLPPFPQALVAGGLAALFTSFLIWLLTMTNLFAAMGVPVAAPVNIAPWAVQRMLWGALAGLIFLVPVGTGAAQWKRGLVVSLLPIAVLLLVIYPRGHEGWFGLELGYSLLAAVVFFWLLWGAVAGWLLGQWQFGVPMGERAASLEDEG